MLQAIINHFSAHYKALGQPSKLLSLVHSIFTPPSHPPLVEKTVDRSLQTNLTETSPASPVAGRQLVWLITGTSTGFGRRLVNSALLRGDFVIATVRSLDNPEPADITIPDSLMQNLRRIQLDVTEGEEALRAKVDEAAGIWGRIDVLVNNAGQGLVGLSEEGGSSLFRRTFDVNVFGMVDMTTVTLPYLRASKGCVVNIGSRSAWKTELVGVGPYSASKAAVHALTETLAVELAPFDVRVMLVAPGAFRTEGIHAKPFYEDRPLAEYDQTRTTTAKRFSSISGTQKGDPAKAMEVLVDIVRGENVAKDKPWPSHLILGEDAINDVRVKSSNILKQIDNWEGVGRAVAF